jgi:hypothetical protein
MKGLALWFRVCEPREIRGNGQSRQSQTKPRETNRKDSSGKHAKLWINSNLDAALRQFRLRGRN